MISWDTLPTMRRAGGVDEAISCNGEPPTVQLSLPQAAGGDTKSVEVAKRGEHRPVGHPPGSSFNHAARHP